MASAAEQMAANLSWSSFGKAKELQQRIWFALGLLIVYRIGTFIPVPGVDTIQLQEFFEQQAAGIGGMLNMFTGGAVSRMAIFALGIMPYISASIIVQLMSAMVPVAGGSQERGRDGAQEAEPVHALRHGAAGDVPGLRDLRGAGGAGAGARSRLVLPCVLRDHAGRWDDVPDVAGRADHRAWHRQRYFADHLCGHHRRTAGGAWRSSSKAGGRVR